MNRTPLEQLCDIGLELRMAKEARRKRDLRLALLSCCVAILAVFCAIKNMPTIEVVLEALSYELRK